MECITNNHHPINIKNNLEDDGFVYLNSKELAPSFFHSHIGHELQALQEFFRELKPDPSPGSRFRAFKKLNYDYKAMKFIENNNNSSYYQTKQTNYDDGGKKRDFAPISEKFMANPFIHELISSDFILAESADQIKRDESLWIGVHQIRYQAQDLSAAFSSPSYLHRDDEDIVFIHLFNYSENAFGGDNLISQKGKTIDKIIKLKNPLDTLVVNKKYLHAVTPLGSLDGKIAYRDILIVTFSNSYNNEIDKRVLNEKN